jgi:hypothetical protein
MCQLGLGLAKTMPVVMLLTDWGRSAAVDIMTVMLGFDPAKIDEDPAGAREWYRIKMAGRIVHFMPDGASVKETFDFADTFGHCAVILDSFQTVAAGIPEIDKAQTFDRNRLLCNYLRERLAATDSRQAHTVLVSSEANRGAYAAKAKEDRSAEIAAPSGGKIDYRSDLLIVIHRPDGETEQREMVFAKNRYRPFLKPLPRSLTVDYQPDGTMFEISAEEAKAQEQSAYQATLVPAKRVIREVLARGQQPSYRKLREAVQIADSSITREVFDKALFSLSKIERSIQEGDGPRGATTYTLAYTDENQDG